ncbi:thioesterase domain-containing protein [Kitasatospora aureofaciens]|uniref:thioesterase II family protein n=1 Tax=Kitasatospora aureofaciens TaxID=1894 RepID=UPI001D790B09|nr:thioesterase domain-containing protein [Kitasatospora aureofaciens]HJD81128.1 alpha/beta fold hydrolase [Kitasatospora aureofaciens]
MIDDRHWYVPLAADGDRRVFGFPHAGAGCAQLSSLADLLAGHSIALWSANLPGRQARLAEPPRTELAGLVDELTDALVERIDDRPYDLFGYCGGAVLAFEVARRLRARSVRLPERMFVVSFEAPDIAWRPRRLPYLPSDVLWEYLTERGGVSGDLAVDPTVRRLVEPAVRADFSWLGEYHCEPDAPLPVRAVVFHGLQDEDTLYGALLGWRRHSTEPVRLVPLDGGHWLLDDACAELADLMAREIAGPAADRPDLDAVASAAAGPVDLGGFGD